MESDWLRPTKPQTASTPRSTAASITRSMNVVLLAPDGGVVVEHVVEVAEVGEPDLVLLEGGRDAAGAVLVEGRAQVEGVGHGVEHGLRGHVRFAGMERGRELHGVGPDLAGERGPVLDRAVGVRVAHRARRQLLQGGGQHADFHEARPEGRRGHGVP